MVAAAFLLGLAGSLHCVGMCSPLAMAVTRISRPALINKVLYNGGRILTYSILGAAAGAVGGIVDFLALQKLYSVLVGAGLVIFGVSGLRSFHIPVISPVMLRATQGVKRSFGSLLKQKTRPAVLALGIANGLLPCGLVYVAVAYSMTATGPVQGFVYMLLFGAGTLPAMVGLPFGLSPLVNKFNFSLPKINAAILILVGLLLVARNFMHLPLLTGIPEMPVDETLCR